MKINKLWLLSCLMALFVQSADAHEMDILEGNIARDLKDKRLPYDKDLDDVLCLKEKKIIKPSNNKKIQDIDIEVVDIYLRTIQNSLFSDDENEDEDEDAEFPEYLNSFKKALLDKSKSYSPQSIYGLLRNIPFWIKNN